MLTQSFKLYSDFLYLNAWGAENKRGKSRRKGLKEKSKLEENPKCDLNIGG